MTRKSRKTAKSASIPTGRDSNRYPKGWDSQRVEAVISHYEGQSDDEAVAEDQAAYRSITSTMMQIPLALMPKIEKLIARAA